MGPGDDKQKNRWLFRRFGHHTTVSAHAHRMCRISAGLRSTSGSKSCCPGVFRGARRCADSFSENDPHGPMGKRSDQRRLPGAVGGRVFSSREPIGGSLWFFWLRYLPLQFVVPASTLGSFPGLFNSVACQGVVSVR